MELFVCATQGVVPELPLPTAEQAPLPTFCLSVLSVLEVRLEVCTECLC